MEWGMEGCKAYCARLAVHMYRQLNISHLQLNILASPYWDVQAPCTFGAGW
eukprot:m.270051 g.270051  ORF g.270051 m.270051 type:complete len:51 (+) comp112137_c0_seq1:128-280(+)